MDKGLRIIQLLTVVSKSYGHAKVDGAMLALYAKALEPLTYAEIETGVTKCMMTCKFFPTVAEIFEAAKSMKQTANNTDKPDAGEAWKEAIDNVKLNGSYKPWKFSCPEVKKAVERFGKMELIMLETNAVNTARAQFMRIYNSELERESERKANEEILKQLGNAKVQALINSTALKLDMRKDA